jgi:hypothetical protein
MREAVACQSAEERAVMKRANLVQLSAKIERQLALWNRSASARRQRFLASRLNRMLPDVGKWLFPRLQRDERMRRMRTLSIALLTGILVAGALAAAIILLNRTSRF